MFIKTMKLITSLIFALAIVGTQARFNLRNYAQQKLKASTDDNETESHIIRDDVQNVIKKIVDRCFEAELGVDNGIITNTVSVAKFDTSSAIDSINLCLQSSNLRLGHNVDSGLTDSMDLVKQAAKDLVTSQQTFNTLIEEETPVLESAMGDIQGAVQSAVKSLNNGYEKQSAEDPQQSAESLETFLASKEEALKNARENLDAEFDSFNDKTSATIDRLTDQIKYVAANETEFKNKRNDLQNNQNGIVTSIVNHYKEVVDGDFQGHAVSGNQGEGCGQLVDGNGTVVFDGATHERAVTSMCKTGMTCQSRSSDGVIAIMTSNEEKNLVFSGNFICSNKSETDVSDGDEVALPDPNSQGICKDSSGKFLPADGTSTGTGCNLVRLNA